jgi:hypothetical protein
MDVLAVKQRLLRNLEQIERSLDPFRSAEPNERRWATPADRERCAGELEDCRRLLDQIVVEERHSETELSRRRDLAGERLQGTHRAHDAHNAYTAGDGRDLSQMDLSM